MIYSIRSEVKTLEYKGLTAEQKARRNRQNAASRGRYEAKTYDKLYIRIRKDGADGAELEQIKAAAQAAGQSVNAWIIEAIRDKL